MPEFTVRSDSVNVEQIMEQIRVRIREKRGVDYTEQEIRELAAVKLEKFLDPRGVRSDLLDAFRRAQAASAPPAPPNYAFGEETLFETHRGPLRFIRRLLAPILKLFFNPNPLIQALHIQSELNTLNAQRETARRGLDQLHFEVVHNLVLETTRMSIELKNLKMRVESMAGRLEFNERRARALESVVVYRPSADERTEQPRSVPDAPAPSGDSYAAGMRPSNASSFSSPSRAAGPAAGSASGLTLVPMSGPTSGPVPGPSPAGTSGAPGEGPGQRSRRRRRRRGRRGGGSVATLMGQPGTSQAPGADVDETPSSDSGDAAEPSASGPPDSDEQ